MAPLDSFVQLSINWVSLSHSITFVDNSLTVVLSNALTSGSSTVLVIKARQYSDPSGLSTTSQSLSEMSGGKNPIG